MTGSPPAQKVLSLPYDERERLLAEILDSLHDGNTGEVVQGDAWDRSWAAELHARLNGLEDGSVATVPADQVLAEMRAGVLPARR
jgi:putative addiction module component (TIGR02574 family)